MFSYSLIFFTMHKYSLILESPLSFYYILPHSHSDIPSFFLILSHTSYYYLRFAHTLISLTISTVILDFLRVFKINWGFRDDDVALCEDWETMTLHFLRIEKRWCCNFWGLRDDDVACIEYLSQKMHWIECISKFNFFSFLIFKEIVEYVEYEREWGSIYENMREC